MIKNMTNSAKINRNDVLCGRGGLTNSHVGNKHFRCVVAEYQLQYLRAKKNEKRDIARAVVARIEENGGRFLQRSAGRDTWSTVSPKRAIDKTSQALREGLDVRHQTVRPNKRIRKRDTNFTRAGNVTKKREWLANGTVADEPRTIDDLQDSVPDLVKDESITHTFEPIFSFFPQAKMSSANIISEDYCENVLQI